MLNNTDNYIEKMMKIGLTKEEARIYIALLKSDSTHLELSRSTGINRTKVYRIVGELEKRSLVTRSTDDRGTFLTASDPHVLEAEVLAREEQIHMQKKNLQEVMPQLDKLKELDKHPFHFEVKTYDGVEGMKQMLWHELRAKGEVYIFCAGPMEDLVPDKKWCDRHRVKTLQAGYNILEIVATKEITPFTEIDAFYDVYEVRGISQDELHIEHQIAIYNDTVAIYASYDDKKVGTEIINAVHAKMFRQIFMNYWKKSEARPMVK